MSRLHEYNYNAPRPGQRSSRWPGLLVALIIVTTVAAGAYFIGRGTFDLGRLGRDLGLSAPAGPRRSESPASGTLDSDLSTAPAGNDASIAQAAQSGATGEAVTGRPTADSATEPTTSAETATATSVPSPAPTEVPPEAIADQYVQRWSDGDYDAMYELLSAEAHASISRPDFVDRYEQVAARAGLTSVTASVAGSPNLQGEVPIEVDYQSSIVGGFAERNRLPMTRDDGGWGVAWTPTLVFKDLGTDGCVDVQNEQPPRGAILDRDREPLAFDGSVHRLGVVAGQIDPADEGRVLQALSELTGSDEAEIRGRYENENPSWFVPIKDFPENRGDELLTAVSHLPGVAIQPATARVYPMGAKAAHLVGYVAPVTAEQLAADPTLSPGQVVGQSGIEAGADELLAGKAGGRLVVVQCETRAERSVIAERPPVPPKDLVLTIDRTLQEAADAALSDQPGDVKGSAVVLDPRNGAVLAMVSHPSFDPNGFVLGFSEKERGAINDDTLRPLLNRAAQAGYPTGSIFKAITFAAGMEELGLTRDTAFDCPSTFTIEGSRQVWEDWTVANGLPAQGQLTFHQALVNSCNTVFYQIGRDLDKADEAALPAMAKAFGLGAPTKIPYLPEVAGTVPDPQWKLDTFGDYWARGDAVNLAIGQGFLTSTPLQMATAYAAIANGGDLLRPYVVAEAIGANGTERLGVRQVRAELPLAEATVRELQSALRDQTSDPNGFGSARVFGDFPWPIAGKTGTAENEQDRAEKKPHSWFAAFGPYGEDATIASTVMIENAGEGIGFAAPASREIYEAYLKTDLAAN